MDPVVRQVVLAVGGTKLGSRGRRRCLVAIWVDCDVREGYHGSFARGGATRVFRAAASVSARMTEAWVEVVVLSVVVVATPRGAHTDKNDDDEESGWRQRRGDGWWVLGLGDIGGSGAVVMVYCVCRVWRWR